MLSKSFQGMPHETRNESIELLERFVVLMYEQIGEATEVNDARRQLFIHTEVSNSGEHSSNSGSGWKQALVLDPDIPEPSERGWTNETNGC